MNELSIRQKIYQIRGQRVMLDFDLAAAYGVETAHLKRQVRRNIERFEGEDFMFEVSHDELLRCQIGTSSWGGSRYGAFAFTVAELQAKEPRQKPRRRIGFIQDE